MTMHTLRLLLAALPYVLLLASCDQDNSVRCLPASLNVNDDSLIFVYDVGRNLARVEYQNRYSPRTTHRKIELRYNTIRKLESVTVSNRNVDLNYWVQDKYMIYYGSDGLPERMENENYLNSDSKAITEFTHDDEGRLHSATTNLVSTEHPENPFFVGGYRYEYNADGNVAKVFYTRKNGGFIGEVLARENLTFDNRSPFYSDP